MTQTSSTSERLPECRSEWGVGALTGELAHLSDGRDHLIGELVIRNVRCNHIQKKCLHSSNCDNFYTVGTTGVPLAY